MPSTPPDASNGLRIDAQLLSKLNLADFRNAVPVLGELQVINEGGQALE